MWMFVEWPKVWAEEPDPRRFEDAQRLLRSDPNRAYSELRTLADRGSIMSMVYLGWAFAEGTGRAADFSQAEYWLKRAFDTGSLLGMFYLGSLYHRHGDLKKACEIWSGGVDKEYAPAIYWLAYIHMKDQGELRDMKKGRQLLEKAAALGHLYARASLGQYMLRGSDGLFGRLKGLGVLLSVLAEAVPLMLRDRNNQRLKPDAP
jgi:uncharacterized protein